MKRLIKKLLREGLNEVRSIEGNISKDENLGELLTHIYDKYGFANTYLSFRDSEHVGKISPNNRFNTPTGLYTYNLSNFIDKPTYDLGMFRKKFPFASDRKYLQFLVTRGGLNLIDSNYDKSKLDGYVKEVQSKFGNIDPVNGLCERWLSNDYQSYYSEAKHPAHKFWLFIYDLIPYIYPDGKKNNSFSIICRALGIDGFHDEKCEGWIHPSEKCQTVFFKSNIFEDEFMLKPSSFLPDIGPVAFPDNEIIKMLSQHKLDPVKDFDKLLPNLDNPKIKQYINNLVANYSKNEMEHLLKFTKEPEKVINALGEKGKEYIDSLTLHDLRYLLNKSHEPGKLMNVLGDIGKEYVSKLKIFDYNTDTRFVDTLAYATEPEKLINAFGDKGVELIDELSDEEIVKAIKNSKEPIKVYMALKHVGEMYMSGLKWHDGSVYNLLVNSSNPEKIISLLRVRDMGKNYLSNLDDKGIYNLLDNSVSGTRRANMLNMLANNDLVLNNLDDVSIDILVSYAHDWTSKRELIKTLEKNGVDSPILDTYS